MDETPAKPDQPTAVKSPRRRWYQFSLRTLLIVVTLAGCGFAIGLTAIGCGTSSPAQQAKRPPAPVTPTEAQRTWASRLRCDVYETNSLGMKFTLIPPGEFTMGEPPTEKGRNAGLSPEHKVKITKPFFIGTYHVTRGQFRQFVDGTGYVTTVEKNGRGSGYTGKFVTIRPGFSWRDIGKDIQTDEHPVVNVSWYDAEAFCRWLSSREGKDYRLPTEAQWEYAARAGTTSRYYFGSKDEDLPKFANCADETLRKTVPGFSWGLAGADGFVFTAPVGSFPPNPFGLYDMAGNAAQWCSDWAGKMPGINDPEASDPQGPEQGKLRVTRGGSWAETSLCRSAGRGAVSPDIASHDIGFRVVKLP